jgi:hypothetical protein
VIVPSGINGFMEDKEIARCLRTQEILPALDRGDRVELDFANVRFATQSFVYALIGGALEKYKDSLLNTMDFKNCTPQMRGVIEMVVSYALDSSEPLRKTA